jgi:tetratricopeptide (TPR) repeat protein
MAKRVRQRPSQPDRRHVRPAPAAVEPAAGVGVFAPVQPPVERPAAEAVSLFEQGMKALQRHAYPAASAHFRGLLSAFPREAALCERAQVYLALCERELARRPAEPRTVEERLTAATAALNNGEDAGAEALARAVLRDAPQQDLALYLVAAIEARRGAADEALRLLGRALAANPELRAQARHDADFEDLRDLEAFRLLLDSPVAPPSGGLRRPRRGRG